MYQERDCSSTLRDLFTPFGLWLPRNSGQQAGEGIYISLKDLKTYIEWWSVFNIQIWDRLNVNNLDYNALLRDMIVVRKEFDWDYMNIYLGKYRKNYALT